MIVFGQSRFRSTSQAALAQPSGLRMPQRLGVLLLTVLALAVRAKADLFVNCARGSDAANCAVSTPCKSLQRALAKAQLLQPTTIQVASDGVCVETSSIAIANAANAAIVGPAVFRFSAPSRGFIVQASVVSLRDLTVIGAALAVNATNSALTITRCNFIEGERAIVAIATAGPPVSLTVESSTFQRVSSSHVLPAFIRCCCRTLAH